MPDVRHPSPNRFVVLDPPLWHVGVPPSRDEPPKVSETSLEPFLPGRGQQGGRPRHLAPRVQPDGPIFDHASGQPVGVEDLVQANEDEAIARAGEVISHVPLAHDQVLGPTVLTEGKSRGHLDPQVVWLEPAGLWVSKRSSAVT